MILQPVQVLVALAAAITTVRFLFLHAQGAWIWRGRFRIQDGEGTVGVIVQLVVRMAML